MAVEAHTLATTRRPARAHYGAESAHDPILAFVRRFVLICSVLALAAAAFSASVTLALLPLFRVEIAWLDDTYRVEDLTVSREGADRVVRLRVALARALTVNGRKFEPEPRGRAIATTLIGNFTVPAILLIATALAWPARPVHRYRRYAWRIAALVPALLLMTFVVPCLLLGAIWGLVVQVADPGRFSPLLLWCECLESGAAAAIAAALGVCVGWLTRDPRRTG